MMAWPDAPRREAGSAISVFCHHGDETFNSLLLLEPHAAYINSQSARTLDNIYREHDTALCNAEQTNSKERIVSGKEISSQETKIYVTGWSE